MKDLQPEEVYTIQEVSKRTGLSIPTLRYYEEIGLIPQAKRVESSRHRRYTEKQVDLLENLSSLRLSGLSLKEMEQYVGLRHQGASGARQQQVLFAASLRKLEKQIQKLELRRKYLHGKLAYWQAVEVSDKPQIEAIVESQRKLSAKLRDL